jgi:RTX calcium-binding nonapeptide repeat (4 copies)
LFAFGTNRGGLPQGGNVSTHVWRPWFSPWLAPSFNPTPRRSFRPHLQELEPRCVPTTGITAVLGTDDILRIQGDNQSDLIQVGQQNNRVWISNVSILSNGHAFSSVSADDVNKILIHTGSGNEQVALPSSMTIPTEVLCGPGNNIVWGGFNDTLIGGGGNDMLIARGGNDSLVAGAGNDSLFGDVGNDTLVGGPGLDYLVAGTGHDVLISGSGNNYLLGGTQSEVLRGGSGNDTIIGGSGNDTIIGGTGNEYLKAGSGNDLIQAGTGKDTLIGGTGNDTLKGGPGNDLLAGGSGTQTLIAGTGNNVLIAGSGNDTLYGGPGNDTLFGGAGNDVLWAGSGNTWLCAGTGKTQVHPGSGIDMYQGVFNLSQPFGNGASSLTGPIEGGPASLAVLRAAMATNPSSFTNRIKYQGSDNYSVELFVAGKATWIPVFFNGVWSGNDAEPVDAAGNVKDAFWMTLVQRAYLEYFNGNASMAVTMQRLYG